jgi:transposase
LIPQDHPVRRLKEILDLRFLYKDTREFYSHEGKPSIDPFVLFKLYLLGYFFGISSERRLFREIQVNLAYRWYLGYDLDEPILDHSIITKSRNRFPSEVFERLFKQIVRLCKDSFRAKLRTEQEYLEELQAGDENRNNFKGHIFDGTVNPDKMGKRRRKAKTNDRLVSSSDPDAQLMSRNGSFSTPAYKAHFCMDRKTRVILSVDGSKASEDDMVKVHSF